MKSILIFGSTGAIGGALIAHYAKQYPEATIHAVSRSGAKPESARESDNIITHQLNFTDDEAIKALAKQIKIDLGKDKLDNIVVAIGTLHDETLQPEKSISQLSFAQFEQVFTANTFIPAMLAKHFTPLLNKTEKSVFAVLSARVGSISDNRLGGWYAYRASKSALNMLIKTASIEIARRNKQAVIMGLHPGTVDSDLSKPFQGNVPEGKLFTPEFSAERLIAVMSGVTAEDSGKCFAWDGTEIVP